MPTYQYRCTECGRDLEVVQKFSDASLTECPTCAGQLRKVFNAVGVVFKGSGFYRNDSRAPDAAAKTGNGEKKNGDKADTVKVDAKSGKDSSSSSTSGSDSGSGSSGSGSSGSGSGSKSDKVSASPASSTGSKATTS